MFDNILFLGKEPEAVIQKHGMFPKMLNVAASGSKDNMSDVLESVSCAYVDPPTQQGCHKRQRLSVAIVGSSTTVRRW